MDFNTEKALKDINVRDFIVENYTPYDGDDSFLVEPTERTTKLWDELSELLKEERSRVNAESHDGKKQISTAQHIDSLVYLNPFRTHINQLSELINGECANGGK